MIDFSPLIPDNIPIVRGYNGWRCEMIRGYFTPNKRIAVTLDRFDSPGSFAFPIVYGVFFVPSLRQFPITSRDDPMTGGRLCPYTQRSQWLLREKNPHSDVLHRLGINILSQWYEFSEES